MQSYKRRNNYLNEQIEIYSMGSKRRLYIFVVFFAILFIGGVASAADPGHGADVVAAGTFESGNYIFPSNLNVTTNFSIGSFFVINPSLSRVGIGTLVPRQALTVAGNISASDTINATKLCIGTDCKSAWSAVGTGNVSGDGTASYIPQWRTGAVLNNSLIFQKGSNIGIGTTSPNNALTVAGDVNVSAASIATLYINKGLSGTIDIGSGTSGSSLISGSASNGHLTINATNTAGGDIILAESSSELIRLTGGKVGIGTASPAHTLTVAGTFNTTNNAFLASNLTVDATDFFVNANTGRVGIGTATPTHTLNVIGNSNFTGNITIDSTDFFVNANTGRVGVGTADPRQALTVAGNISASDTINATKLCIGTDCKSAWSAVGTGNVSGDGTASYIPQWRTGAVLNNSLIFQKGSNIGIGTTSPNNALTVAGDVNVSAASIATLYINKGLSGTIDIGSGTSGSSLISGSASNGHLTINATNTAGGDIILAESSSELIRLTGGKVGIGTASPAHTLTVAGTFNTTNNAFLASNLTVDATDFFVNANTGRVGIGTAAPTQTLTVAGNISASDTINATKLCIGTDCKSAWSAVGTG